MSVSLWSRLCATVSVRICSVQAINKPPQCLRVSPFDLQRCSRPAQHREALRLAVVGADLRLVFGEARHASPSGQDHQGVARHAPELEGERPVEDHDEHAVDPLKDGGGVLQGGALLAEENPTW